MKKLLSKMKKLLSKIIKWTIGLFSATMAVAFVVGYLANNVGTNVSKPVKVESSKPAKVKQPDPADWDPINPDVKFPMPSQGSNQPKKPIKLCADTTSQSSGAYVMLKYHIPKFLRSPETASFPWGYTKSEYLGSCIFRITGHVDSQNAYGATIRTHWVGKVRSIPERDTWSVISVDFK